MPSTGKQVGTGASDQKNLVMEWCVTHGCLQLAGQFMSLLWLLLRASVLAVTRVTLWGLGG